MLRKPKTSSIQWESSWAALSSTAFDDATWKLTITLVNTVMVRIRTEHQTSDTTEMALPGRRSQQPLLREYDPLGLLCRLFDILDLVWAISVFDGRLLEARWTYKLTRCVNLPPTWNAIGFDTQNHGSRMNSVKPHQSTGLVMEIYSASLNVSLVNKSKSWLNSIFAIR